MSRLVYVVTCDQCVGPLLTSRWEVVADRYAEFHNENTDHTTHVTETQEDP